MARGTRRRRDAACARPRKPMVVILSISKGGTGKTTLAVHLAYRAQERGWRVLVVDCERQADAFRRLGGDKDAPTRIHNWAEGCFVVCQPETYSIPDEVLERFDLLIVDSPPRAVIPEGTPEADLVLAPIDGFDAAEGARDTVASASEVPVWFVLNRHGEAGKRHAKVLEQIEEALPEGVSVSEVVVPHGRDIKHTDLTRRPAWEGPYNGRSSAVLAEWADEVLDWLVEVG